MNNEDIKSNPRHIVLSKIKLIILVMNIVFEIVFYCGYMISINFLLLTDLNCQAII